MKRILIAILAACVAGMCMGQPTLSDQLALLARKKAAGGGGGGISIAGMYGSWGFDDSSGNIVDQHSGGHDFTVSGSPTYSATALTNGTAVTFDTSSMASIADSAALTPGAGEDLVIACAVKFNSLGGSINSIVAKYNTTGAQREYFLWYDNTNGDINARVSSNGIAFATVQATAIVPDTASTYFIIMSFDNTADELTLWVSDDGGALQKATVAFASDIYNSSAPLEIGGQAGNAALGDNTVDDLHIWIGADVAFDDAKAAELFNSGAWRTYAEL